MRMVKDENSNRLEHKQIDRRPCSARNNLHKCRQPVCLHHSANSLRANFIQHLFFHHVSTPTVHVLCSPRNQVSILPLWPCICRHKVTLASAFLFRSYAFPGSLSLPAINLSNNKTPIFLSSFARQQARLRAHLHVLVRFITVFNN